MDHLGNLAQKNIHFKGFREYTRNIPNTLVKLERTRPNQSIGEMDDNTGLEQSLEQSIEEDWRDLDVSGEMCISYSIVFGIVAFFGYKILPEPSNFYMGLGLTGGMSATFGYIGMRILKNNSRHKKRDEI